MRIGVLFKNASLKAHKEQLLKGLQRLVTVPLRCFLQGTQETATAENTRRIEWCARRVV